jgi:lipoprotein-anchoring transpeptidase ErfK/SrfK
MIKELLLASCLLGASTAVFAGKAKAPPAAQAVDAEFEQGRATAKADFAAGRPGWYFFFYSNMPNGPDDPVQARERDLFIALLEERASGR